jgi:hypothetical protein
MGTKNSGNDSYHSNGIFDGQFQFPSLDVLLWLQRTEIPTVLFMEQ